MKFQSKIPAGLFVKICKLILKVIWKSKGHRVTKTTLKKNKVRGPTLCSRLTIKLQKSRQCGIAIRI